MPNIEPLDRVYAVITILVLIVSAVVGYNFAQDAQIEKLAHDAKETALTARPYPYTSKMYAVDQARHEIDMNDKLQRERELFSSKLLALKYELSEAIQSLPRPPEHTNIRLLKIESLILEIKVEIAVIKASVLKNTTTADVDRAKNK